MAGLQILIGLDPFEYIETLEGTNGPVASFRWVIVNAMFHYSVLGSTAMHKISHEICATTSDEVKKWISGEIIPNDEQQKQVITALAKDLRQRYDDCVALGLRFPSVVKRVPKVKESKKVALPVIQNVKVVTKTDLDAIDEF